MDMDSDSQEEDELQDDISFESDIFDSDVSFVSGRTDL